MDFPSGVSIRLAGESLIPMDFRWSFPIQKHHENFVDGLQPPWMTANGTRFFVWLMIWMKFPKDGTIVDMIFPSGYDRVSLFHLKGKQLAPMVDGDSSRGNGWIWTSKSQKCPRTNNHFSARSPSCGRFKHGYFSLSTHGWTMVSWSQPSSNVRRSSSNPEPKGPSQEIFELWAWLQAVNYTKPVEFYSNKTLWNHFGNRAILCSCFQLW